MIISLILHNYQVNSFGCFGNTELNDAQVYIVFTFPLSLHILRNIGEDTYKGEFRLLYVASHGSFNPCITTNKKHMS